jgi:hypothetical protein
VNGELVKLAGEMVVEHGEYPSVYVDESSQLSI